MFGNRVGRNRVVLFMSPDSRQRFWCGTDQNTLDINHKTKTDRITARLFILVVAPYNSMRKGRI